MPFCAQYAAQAGAGRTMIGGPLAVILMALAGVVLFVALTGGLIWLYSAQSAKRRKQGQDGK
jgi:hypothetical protein